MLYKVQWNLVVGVQNFPFARKRLVVVQILPPKWNLLVDLHPQIGRKKKRLKNKIISKCIGRQTCVMQWRFLLSCHENQKEILIELKTTGTQWFWKWRELWIECEQIRKWKENHFCKHVIGSLEARKMETKSHVINGDCLPI